MPNHNLQQEFAGLEASSSYLKEHYAELQDAYGASFVAIYDQQVVASAESFQGLMQLLAEKGLDLRRVIVEFIPRKGEIILY